MVEGQTGHWKSVHLAEVQHQKNVSEDPVFSFCPYTRPGSLVSGEQGRRASSAQDSSEHLFQLGGGDCASYNFSYCYHIVFNIHCCRLNRSLAK